MKNRKSRDKARLTDTDKTWQGRMSVKITFGILEGVDVQEIRNVLDSGKAQD